MRNKVKWFQTLQMTGSKYKKCLAWTARILGLRLSTWKEFIIKVDDNMLNDQNSISRSSAIVYSYQLERLCFHVFVNVHSVTL